MGVTHALVTYVTVDLALGPNPALLAALGSLLPDLDHPNSLAARLILRPLERTTGIQVRRLVYAHLGHRGFLHSPWPWLLGALLLWQHHRILSLLMLGGLLHVLQDALTARGIPVLPGRGGWVRVALTPIPGRWWDRALAPASALILLVTMGRRTVTILG
ncbi:MAG: metal-dependent hydrolase [Euryarchaeota archaeon]